MTNQKYIEYKQKEFDKWFNHGTKSKPRFLLSSDFYNEVKDFLSTAIQEGYELGIKDCIQETAVLYQKYKRRLKPPFGNISKENVLHIKWITDGVAKQLQSLLKEKL